MTGVLLAAGGSALGGAARYLLAGWLDRPGFPWGTLLVNVLGCAAIGLVWAWWGQGSWQRTLFASGVLGGFTTFSAFSVQTLVLIQDGRLPIALGYITASLGLCLLAVAAGYQLGR